MQGGDYRYPGRGRPSYAPDPYGREDPYNRRIDPPYMARDDAMNLNRADRRPRNNDPYLRDDLADEEVDMSPVVPRKQDRRPVPQRDTQFRPAMEPGTAGGGPVAIYELDHLATFTISPKQGLLRPSDGVKRLREMEATTGVWAMRVQLRVDRREIVVMEKSTLKEIECFPISRVSNPANITDNSQGDLYNNVVLFTVQGDAAARLPSEMHLFQCIRKPGQELVDDIEAAISGHFPRRPAARERQVPEPYQSPGSSEGDPSLGDDFTQRPTYEDKTGRSAYNRYAYNGPAQRQRDDGFPSSKRPLGIKDDLTSDDIMLLNHCFDDIEGFVASLQQAANAQKELERRRMMSGGRDPAEEMLRSRAQPPALKDFIDTFQKFKVAFNLLPKLKSALKDPDAVQLLHMLFSPLGLIVNASCDASGQPVVAPKVESPLLTADACAMLDSCLDQREAALWRSLGPAWNTPSNRWTGVVPPYVPQFADGYRHPGFNMDDVGLALPSANFNGSMPRQNMAYNTSSAVSDYSRHIPNGNQYGQSTNPTNQYLPPQNPPPQIAPQGHQPGPVPAQGQPQGPQTGSANINPNQQQYLNELKSRGARIFVAMVARDGKNNKELNVRVGDVVEILDSTKNWWKAKNHANAMGFVPNTILKQYTDN